MWSKTDYFSFYCVKDDGKDNKCVMSSFTVGCRHG